MTFDWIAQSRGLAIVLGGALLIATVLGFAICLARLSHNWLLARLAGLYVEIVRNLPLLLQMFVWYAVLLFSLSPPGSFSEGGLGLDNRGFTFDNPNAKSTCGCGTSFSA